MKKLLIPIALLLVGCEAERTYRVEIEDCRTGKMDTVEVVSSGEPRINTYKEAVPVLMSDRGWSPRKNVLNVCKMRILDVR